MLALSYSQSVAHVLMSCPHLRSCRARHLGRTTPEGTLIHILGDESDLFSTGGLFSFIRVMQLIPCDLPSPVIGQYDVMGAI